MKKFFQVFRLPPSRGVSHEDGPAATPRTRRIVIFLIAGCVLASLWAARNASIHRAAEVARPATDASGVTPTPTPNPSQAGVPAREALGTPAEPLITQQDRFASDTIPASRAGASSPSAQVLATGAQSTAGEHNLEATSRVALSDSKGGSPGNGSATLENDPMPLPEATEPAEEGEIVVDLNAPDGNEIPQVLLTEEKIAEDLVAQEMQQEKLQNISSIGAAGTSLLQGYLTDADPGVASAAFSALSDLDPNLALRALLEVVKDPAEPVRLQALQLLLNQSDPETGLMTALLRDALKDPDTAFVETASQSLSQRADPEAIRILSEALRDGDLSTRLSIVNALASNGSAVSLLYQALRDPEPDVSSAARAVLFPSNN